MVLREDLARLVARLGDELGPAPRGGHGDPEHSGRALEERGTPLERVHRLELVLGRALGYLAVEETPDQVSEIHLALLFRRREVRRDDALGPHTGLGVEHDVPQVRDAQAVRGLRERDHLSGALEDGRVGARGEGDVNAKVRVRHGSSNENCGGNVS